MRFNSSIGFVWFMDISLGSLKVQIRGRTDIADAFPHSVNSTSHTLVTSYYPGFIPRGVGPLREVALL